METPLGRILMGAVVLDVAELADARCVKDKVDIGWIQECIRENLQKRGKSALFATAVDNAGFAMVKDL